MAANLQPRAFHNSPDRGRHDRIPSNRYIYESPRIDAPDSALFPTQEHLLTSSNSLARWKYMARLAGGHQQPHDRMHVNLQRVSCPQALEAGVPSSIGGNIQTLHLPLNDASQLPEWLDAISKVFPNLLHLYFTTDTTTSLTTSHDGTSDTAAGHCETSDADNAANNNAENPHRTTVLSDETLVRRLYVLYRLPRLKSMDGQPFSDQEKKLSRPRERSNQSKQHPSEEDPTTSPTQDTKRSCLLDESSDEECADVTTIADNREVEIGLNGKPMPCDPDRWEYASVESSAVACEWGCGISSLPYFQRNKNKKKPKWKSKRSHRTTPPQTEMRLNQFTFEDSIEIDDKTASEVCRISTPPNETLLKRNESPISTSSSSHSKSPKSNQENFASRTPPIRSLTSPFPMQFRSAGRVTERVDKLIGAIFDESPGVPSSDVATRDTIDNKPSIPLTRIQSSPSNLGSKLNSSTTNRPPPCPGRRAPLGTRPQRTKRRQNRWRERLTARSNSIFDDDDDEDDQSDNDNKDCRVQLEPKGIRLNVT